MQEIYWRVLSRSIPVGERCQIVQKKMTNRLSNRDLGQSLAELWTAENSMVV